MAIYLIILGVLLILFGAACYWRVQLLVKLKGYRTIVWNLIVGLLPVALTSLDKLQALDLAQYMTPPNAIIAGAIIAGIGIWLRIITTGPVGSKGEETPPPSTKAGD